MSDSTAIHVDGVSKEFRVVTNSSSYGRLSEIFTNVGRRLRGRSNSETFWALKDVDFTVPEGQAVGLIGHNGAGKSTLLKVVSRITRPTRGRVGVAGRVGSLLEVGTGFHPELTGRENIFVNGAILGMTRREVRTRLDEIVAFAEVERFLDTPVKRYSSGMKVRLAFAVAAHLEPEVMLVDEVLAVGDAAFQKKCLGKMGEVAGGGRTILFVSHNLLAVRALCQRAIWLDHGEVRDDGPAAEVALRYTNALDVAQTERTFDPGEIGGRGVTLKAARVTSESAEGDDEIDVHTPVTIEVEIDVSEADIAPGVGFFIRNAEQVPVCFPISTEGIVPTHVGQHTVRMTIPGDLLNVGRYSVAVMLFRDVTEIVGRLENALAFIVEEDTSQPLPGEGRLQGVVRPAVEWSTGGP